MRNDRIAVLGDKDSILSLKAVGFDAFFVDNEDDAKSKLKALTMNYKLIIVTEDVAIALSETIDKYKSKSLPIIIPLPTLKSNTGYGINCVRENVEKAIGTDILNKDKK